MAEKHFILVHGACHGAWCWYKLKPLLTAVGHRVTLLDLAASGINSKTVDQVRTLSEYSEPLLATIAAIPPNQKAILVGHSLAGLSLALAMDTYPEKIAVAVFLTAYVPDTVHSPSYVFDKYSERNHIEDLLDVEFFFNGSTTEVFASMLFGPKFMSSYLYQLSPVEDLELAKSLVRPSSVFTESLSRAEKFSEEKYGCVAKVYVMCSEDRVIRKEYQKWMVENCGIEDVMEIDGADHMAMFSKPLQLCHCLLEIALKYG